MRRAGHSLWRGAPATAAHQERHAGPITAAIGIRHLSWSAGPGWQLAACASMHVVNDALFAGVYPLLPLVAADLALSYAQAGAIKTAYTGASAAFQVPAGFAAERLGEHLLLALGTGWVGAGLLGMAAAAGFWPLVALGLLAGVGGGVQHPVASSVVARVFDGGRRATAIGTLNFAGDLGKVLAPLVVGSAAIAAGWRGGFLALGGLGLLAALLYLLAVPHLSNARPSAPDDRRRIGDGGGPSTSLSVARAPAGGALAGAAAGPGGRRGACGA